MSKRLLIAVYATDVHIKQLPVHPDRFIMYISASPRLGLNHRKYDRYILSPSAELRFDSLLNSSQSHEIANFISENTINMKILDKKLQTN